MSDEDTESDGAEAVVELPPDLAARSRFSIWHVKLDPTMRFRAADAKPVLAVHHEDGDDYAMCELLRDAKLTGDLSLGPDEPTWRVVGFAFLVYPEAAGEGPSPKPWSATVFERRVYVIEAPMTKSAVG